MTILLRRVLQNEHHLEQRAAVFFHQASVRQVLVRVGAERGLADALEQFPERRIPAQARAQQNLVAKAADQSFDLDQGPVRYAGRDDDLVVAGIMVQQTLKTGHQHHEQTHTLLPAQPPQRIGQLSRQHGAFPCAAIDRARRSGKVRWQMLKAGRAVDLLIPVRQPGFQFFSLQLAPLPPDVIAVLIGDVRQG